MALETSLLDAGLRYGTAGLDDLAMRVGELRVAGQYARGRCPLCDSRTGCWAHISDKGVARVGCFGCGDWKALRAVAGLTGGAAPRFAPSRNLTRASCAPDMIEDADQLDAVYRVLLRHLAMTANHRRCVLGRDRGVPANVRERVGPLMGPVPGDAAAWRRVRQRLVPDLLAIAPYEFLIRVPEISARSFQSFSVLHTRAAAHYFEPWRDERGRIVALRAYMGRAAEPKYKVTYGRSGAIVHVAVGVAPEAIASAPWLFTEGWMKAEVAAHALGAVGIALPGVTSRAARGRAIEIKQRMAPDAPAYVAFDAEVWTTRPDIAIAALDLAYAIEHATGRPAGFAIWDARLDAEGKPSPKGIDDAIVAGVDIRLVDRQGLGRVLGPALASWEAADAA